MALMPHYYTTSRTSRPKAKAKTPAILKAEAENAELLKKLGYVKPLKTKKKLQPEPKVVKSDVAPTSDKIDGFCPKKEEMAYSGERKLLGIAVMHKSNLVPVFADQPEEVAEIGRMRRG